MGDSEQHGTDSKLENPNRELKGYVTTIDNVIDDLKIQN